MTYRRTFFNTLVVERTQLAQRVFAPIPFLVNAHTQTVLCTVLADLMWLFMRPLLFEQTFVTTFDNNTFSLDWYLPPDPDTMPTAVASAHLGSHAQATFRNLISTGHHDPISTTPLADDAPVVVLLYGIGGTRDE